MAWNGERMNRLNNMYRLDEAEFPDGLTLLRKNKAAEREQRELRAAIKASQKGYTGMKNALSIEENSASPANVRASAESSGDSSSSGSESSNGGASPRAPRKEKKPKSKKERVKRAKEMRRLRVT